MKQASPGQSFSIHKHIYFRSRNIESLLCGPEDPVINMAGFSFLFATLVASLFIVLIQTLSLPFRDP